MKLHSRCQPGLRFSSEALTGEDHILWAGFNFLWFLGLRASLPLWLLAGTVPQLLSVWVLKSSITTWQQASLDQESKKPKTEHLRYKPQWGFLHLILEVIFPGWDYRRIAEQEAPGIFLPTQTTVPLVDSLWCNYFGILRFIGGLQLPGEGLDGNLG